MNEINPDWGQNKERDAEEEKAWRLGEVDSDDGYPKSREKVVNRSSSIDLVNSGN